MQKIPCSVPILTLNAERHLARCLDSLKDFEDVYLVDGNSTDRTHEIAKERGVPIYKQVETDEPDVRVTDFTAMRVRSYSFAKMKWLLDLDSDEFLTPELVEEIRTVIKDSTDPKIAYDLQNKLIFGDKVVHYAFSYPIYQMRLYHTDSGIGFTKHKTLHEKVTIPEDVTIKKLTHPILSEGIASYKDAVAKDNRYLDIVRKKYFPEDRTKLKKYRGHIARSAVRNVLQAVHVLLESLWVYLRHGHRQSLPFVHVVRHVRYDLIISWLRLKQLWYSFF